MTTHEDIMDRLKRGEDRFRNIEAQQTAILAALEPLKDVREDVAATKEIVEAWAAVKTAGKFIRWLGIIVGSLIAIAGGIKLGIAHMIGGIR